eukprot:m.91356 g.91356  ORF g.91356 m.91356 type:complete len:100 (+) comp14632_c1_seq1:133-432(+)
MTGGRLTFHVAVFVSLLPSLLGDHQAASLAVHPHLQNQKKPGSLYPVLARLVWRVWPRGFYLTVSWLLIVEVFAVHILHAPLSVFLASRRRFVHLLSRW